MLNEFDIIDAIDEFEETYAERWDQYEILPAQKRAKNKFKVYDEENDKYIDIRRCGQLLSDLSVVLAKHGMQVAKLAVSSRLENRKSAYDWFKIEQAVSYIEQGYEKIEEALRSKYGKYITRLSISKDYDNKPHFKFSYMGNPSEEIRREIKEYIISTYQS